MVIFWLAIALINSLSSEALNVTVRPFPEVESVWGEPVSIACEVGGRRGPSSVIVLRWVVRPDREDEEVEEDPPLTGQEKHQSPQDPPLIGQEQRQSTQQEFLLVKLNVRGAEFWGNYTQRFGPAHFTLRHDDPGNVYTLLLSNVTLADRGLYSCRAQEVRKHRMRWKAIANATAHTQLRVHPVVNTTRADCIWRLFEDLYLCAAVLCSIGLVSILLFAMVITCQQLMRRTRPKDNYSLVKCPDSSSGETVTSEASSTSTSSGGRMEGVKVPLPLLSSRGMVKVPLPLMTTGGSSREMVKVPPRDASGARVSSARPHRKQKRHKHPPDPPDAPPVLPAKAPRIQKPRRTKLLKAQPRRTAVVAEDSLTYAELELVKAKPEPTAQQPTASCSGTVYAQIRF